ncbi:MAG: bifunctional methionine sulfoxide reductase B/A protein [Ignavibacteria bacterium]|nr:bifunctional methionine sulfoxide reductase B/A protein [Ignavibacteria bacterium]
MDTIYNKLTPEEERVIIHKGTEYAFTGEYYDDKEKGTYICKRCNAPLYRSEDKFDSGCGWPSFDDEIEGAVKKLPDKDGMRTEIICANCGGHLGHVFIGEGFTPKDTRHCVNSISMKFIPYGTNMTKKTDTAYFAGGCFWGVEHLMKTAEGVIDVKSGYIGGSKENPTYKEVCWGNTGHAEAVEIIFEPETISYEKLLKLFFEIHDFTQVNRQGSDIGEQYRSGVFYLNDEQKKTAEKVIGILTGMGYKVATEISKADKFWVAEDYHQNYYDVTGKQPYCHTYRKIFN